MVKSGSNRSLFQNNKKPISRSRQNTIGLDFTGEDLVRNIGSDYQDIQIRTLTKWVNAQLKQVDESIDNIKTDLRDGKKLLKLLSVISNETAPKPERMNMRIHQLANVAQALGFLEKQVGSDTMPDIGNEAIVNGDAKKTLALIFFIMLKYQIQLILTEHGDDYIQSLCVSFFFFFFFICYFLFRICLIIKDKIGLIRERKWNEIRIYYGIK